MLWRRRRREEARQSRAVSTPFTPYPTFIKCIQRVVAIQKHFPRNLCFLNIFNSLHLEVHALRQSLKVWRRTVKNPYRGADCEK